MSSFGNRIIILRVVFEILKKILKAFLLIRTLIYPGQPIIRLAVFRINLDDSCKAFDGFLLISTMKFIIIAPMAYMIIITVIYAS